MLKSHSYPTKVKAWRDWGTKQAPQEQNTTEMTNERRHWSEVYEVVRLFAQETESLGKGKQLK